MAVTLVPPNSETLTLPKNALAKKAVLTHVLVHAVNDFSAIQLLVTRAARRLRWQRAWAGFWIGFLWGAALILATLIAFKLLPIPMLSLVLAAAAWGLAALAGFFAGFWRPISSAETARRVERCENLQERLSTALEVQQSVQPDEWKRLVMADAARHADRIDPRRIFPIGLPAASRWALLLLAIIAGLGFVPEYRSTRYVQRQREQATIRETGQQIAQLTRRSLEQRPPVLEPVKESLEAVAQLGDQLGRNPVSRTEALKDLASIAEKLKQDLRELGKNPALKSLEKAARESNRSGGNSPGELQKQIAALQNSLGDKASNPEALDKLRRNLEEARRQGDHLPNKESAEGASARQKLAEALSDMARQARQLGENLPGLDEAIAALQANQTDLFLKDLDQALNDLEKTQELAKALQQLQQQASKPGKDLAEQLKMGQAEAAQETLQRMVDQLKRADLSQQQLNDILEQVKKAVDPASPYGKVAQHLSQAGQQMQQGQKPNAAQSLSDAAKELDKLMQQMGDAQALASTLEALKKAQMCVGNAQSWAQCKAPGSGKGGKPGSGVGTWAEETGWLYYPEKLTERWDNTGINRSDMDPRGQTDRGEGQLAQGTTPTKVKGQFTPGGPMPGITLKGVSIKGQSTVGFQEAATAAQNEAQSALNQDQVPKAYQGAVRDYFDDLKK